MPSDNEKTYTTKCCACGDWFQSKKTDQVQRCPDCRLIRDPGEVRELVEAARELTTAYADPIERTPFGTKVCKAVNRLRDALAKFEE